jgi:hypothetical protein
MYVVCAPMFVVQVYFFISHEHMDQGTDTVFKYFTVHEHFNQQFFGNCHALFGLLLCHFTLLYCNPQLFPN